MGLRAPEKRAEYKFQGQRAMNNFYWSIFFTSGTLDSRKHTNPFSPSSSEYGCDWKGLSGWNKVIEGARYFSMVAGFVPTGDICQCLKTLFSVATVGVWGVLLVSHG